MKKWLHIMPLLFMMLCLMQPLKTQAGWKSENGNYYFYNAAGELERSKKIGQYYVNSKGARIINKWKGGSFYGENGKRIPDFKGGFQTIDGNVYYYLKSGQKQIGFQKIGKNKYYFDLSGVMQLGWKKIDGYYYFFSKNKKSYGAMLRGWQTIYKKKYYLSANLGKLQLGWFHLNGKKYYADTQKGLYTGIQKIDENLYMFDNKGILQTGWKKIRQKTYYCIRSNGVMATGLGSIGGKLYYFNNKGVMQKNTSITIDDISYVIDEKGICQKITKAEDTPEDMLFFTLYESGIDGYGQVGGDNGNACGKYQFDRRYSLIPLVKYCYSKDPVIFGEFAPFAKYSNTVRYQDKLKNNKKFYTAWTNIYKKYPLIFKNYQDAFALEHYYQPVENQLKSWGIDISKRPNVIKGAVFSYSIQHGSYTAALAVRSAGINNTVTDKNFIKNLYNYRMNTYSAYRSRYSNEMKDALSRL